MSVASDLPSPASRPERLAEMLAYYGSIPFTWARQFVSNANGILHVLDITRFRPMPCGLIGPDHPWVTGLNPATGKPIWPENILFRSARTPGAGAEGADDRADDGIVHKVGRFLAAMPGRSAAVPEIPWGPRRRMPHGINYIHGAAHYNSGILIFNDFADGIGHFSDPRFTAEVRRFARTEKREILLMFRGRRYEPRDYAYFVAFLRTVLPWFCNSNGPERRVLWGNPSPYPVANIIVGHWIRDVYLLRRPGGAAAVVRPPVPAGKYFIDGPYQARRREARWPERLLAHWTHRRIRRRGPKGGLFFVDRRRLLAGRLERLRRGGAPDEPIAPL